MRSHVFDELLTQAPPPPTAVPRTRGIDPIPIPSLVQQHSDCWTPIVGFTSPQHPVLLLRFYITLLALIRGTRDTEVGRMFRSHMIPLCLLSYLSFKVHHALPPKKNYPKHPKDCWDEFGGSPHENGFRKG